MDDDLPMEDAEGPRILGNGLLSTVGNGEDEEESEEEQDIGEGGAQTSTVADEALTTRKRKKPAAREGDGQIYVNSNEVHASLVQLFEKEQRILGMVYNSAEQTDNSERATADMFFISNLLVPPTRYRKEAKRGADEIAENQDNESYKKILSCCENTVQITRELTGVAENQYGRLHTFQDLQSSWLRLQDAVNSLIDRDRNPVKGQAALRNPEGIKQKLEKKEGMFRMNIMGKRVNFAARSVISPDPNIETNEIGVPPVFAKKLTYPEPVTSWNIEELKQAVNNGPSKWPGASAVEYENGQLINLKFKNDEERQALANMLLAPSNNSMTGARNKKVHRHLNNGDIVIMNRQPTLHKPSMMCHRARVLPGEKTIRMHYANCNTYNADFDGDEMNMHFPQNEVARAEALQIADTDHQYLSGTVGKPLRGLIQDHISISVWLTSQDMFFTREEYYELLYSCLRPEHNHTTTDRILTIDPAIWRPRARWTGKQIISTILLNIKPESYDNLNLTSKSSVSSDRWGPGSSEGEVLIQDGQLVTGILDKKQIGPEAGGLVHTVYEAYGHTVAGKLLSILGRLLTRMLNMRAFSCGVEDLILTAVGERERRETLKGASTIGTTVAARYVSLEKENVQSDNAELLNRLESVLRDEQKQAGLDAIMNSHTAPLSSEITKKCLPVGLVKPFPKNQMQLMTTSGAKGSVVNANLISCNLGQQVLEGRRVPVMISGKTLPSFKAFDSNIRAGGYIVDRFLTGIRPQEYFFHAMAGREGLIDTAVKTSRSGYLQRCIIKGLEGLRVEYDTSVRDSDGTMVQTLYGEDGLDITKQRNLMDFTFVARNFYSLFSSLNVREDLSRIINPEAIEWMKEAVKDVRKKGYRANVKDPVMSVYPPGSHAGSTSEKYYQAAKKYIDDNPDKLIRSKKNGILTGHPKAFMEGVFSTNYMKAVVQPGEAVGVVAGQSIGEPSTQMTLNTFHLAGHSTKNVTLGIPRLREIIMTASLNIKTPTMTMYPIAELPRTQVDAFAKGISKLSLAETLDEVKIVEKVTEGMYGQARVYDIRLKLYPSQEYIKEYNIIIADVAKTLEIKFVPMLVKKIRAELKKRGDEKTLRSAAKSDAVPDIGKAARKVRQEAAQPQADNEGGDSDDEDAGDDDATDAKRKSNLDEGATYEEPDDSDEEILRRGEREASAASSSESEADSTYGGSEKSAEDSNEETSRRKKAKLSAKDREARLKMKYDDLSSFAFDDKRGAHCQLTLEYPTTTAKLLLLGIVNDCTRAALVQSIPDLKSATVLSEKTPATGTEEVSVMTEGANLLAMREYQDIINPHRLLTNDVGAMLHLYGVEAARETVIREVRAVFEGHAIKVDHRHLTLVADYMTRGGGYTSFSRMGMRDKRSPFAKMSFETTFGFLTDAVFAGDHDDLKDPSARITVGQVSRMGTGMFDVMTPVF